VNQYSPFGLVLIVGLGFDLLKPSLSANRSAGFPSDTAQHFRSDVARADRRARGCCLVILQLIALPDGISAYDAVDGSSTGPNHR